MFKSFRYSCQPRYCLHVTKMCIVNNRHFINNIQFIFSLGTLPLLLYLLCSILTPRSSRSRGCSVRIREKFRHPMFGDSVKLLINLRQRACACTNIPSSASLRTSGNIGRAPFHLWVGERGRPHANFPVIGFPVKTQRKHTTHTKRRTGYAL